MSSAIERDTRVTTPLYSVSDAARYIDVPRSTLTTWVRGYHRGDRRQYSGEPIITSMPPAKRGYPTLPFIGLAEAYALNAFREAGVPLQRIRASLAALSAEVGPHALASERLMTDGAEILWDQGIAGERGEIARLVVPRSNQYVFVEVVQDYLRTITFEGEFASLIRLPRYRTVPVVLDPRRGGGRPIFADIGVEVENVLGRVRAGEDVQATADDFGLPATALISALATRA